MKSLILSARTLTRAEQKKIAGGAECYCWKQGVEEASSARDCTSSMTTDQCCGTGWDGFNCPGPPVEP
ncbi:MAG: hypothetical protein QM731_18460 [Chitinophagaceae bacterium]